MDWLRRPSGLLIPPEPRLHRSRYCDLFGGSMMGAPLPPETIRSQATTIQTLVIPVACIMDAMGWGAGGGKFNPFDTSVVGGGGAFAEGYFDLYPGDVVTYASGGPGIPATGVTPSSPGTSGDGLHNGGDGDGPGGGATLVWINGVLVLIAAGGGGAAQTSGGPGGAAAGQPGADAGYVGGSTGGGGASPGAPGAGGICGGTGDSSKDGSPGSGGNGGNAGTLNGKGGGGGGGRYGGGGGAGAGFSAVRTGGGSGCSYTSDAVTGVLTAATDWHGANASDPDRPANAGNAEQPGAVVLKFTAA